MFNRVLTAILGTRHERDLKRIQPILDAIHEHEARLAGVSDTEVQAQTTKFRAILAERTHASGCIESHDLGAGLEDRIHLLAELAPLRPIDHGHEVGEPHPAGLPAQLHILKGDDQRGERGRQAGAVVPGGRRLGRERQGQHRHWHADPARWVFATGTTADIQHVVVEGFKVGYGKVDDGAGAFEIMHGNWFVLVDAGGVIRGAVEDLLDGVSPSIVSAKFHLGVARLIASIAKEIREERKLNRVALSGGVFQNMLLLVQTCELLRNNGFQVFTHCRVPTNDGGISLGQAAIANARLRSGRI